jgi:hypothetical protein
MVMEEAITKLITEKFSHGSTVSISNSSMSDLPLFLLSYYQYRGLGELQSLADVLLPRGVFSFSWGHQTPGETHTHYYFTPNSESPEFTEAKKLVQDTVATSRAMGHDLFLMDVIKYIGRDKITFDNFHSSINKLQSLSKIIRFFGYEQLVIFIDSLDDNLLLNPAQHPKALKHFVETLLTQKLFALATDSTFKIKLQFFFPGNAFNYREENGFRQTKARVVDLQWSSAELKRYADVLLERMESERIGGCKSLPSFSQLVGLESNSDNDRDVIEQLVQGLKVPRHLNMFVEALTKQLEGKCHAKKDFSFTVGPCESRFVQAAVDQIAPQIQRE